MKGIYFELNMGASGDMIMGSLFELIEDKEGFLEKINSIGLEGVKVFPRESIKSGISGTNMAVVVNGLEEESIDVNHHHHHHDHHHEHEHEHNHEHQHDHDHEHTHDHDHHHDHHSHNSYLDVLSIIDSLDLKDNIKADAKAIYEILGKGESKAHNKPMTEVHFHEVGTLDAIVDIVGACILMDMIKPEKIVASPINVGQGHVKCAHGLMPVPAPATLNILENVPIYSNGIMGELCTPTGAAILKHFVDSFEKMPEIQMEKVGYGMGKKDFEAANCVRTILGNMDSSEKIVQLEANMDDITGEEIGFLYEILLENKALDLYTSPIIMKKNRPGLLLTVLVDEKNKENILSLIFKHSTTIGIKEFSLSRHKLVRSEESLNSEFGLIRKKVSKGYGITREKFEFEDLKKISKENDISIREILRKLKN